MTAPNTVILSAPAAWVAEQGLEALLAQFGCEQVITDWNPRCVHVGGALHITTMRPEPLQRHLQFNKPWLARCMHQRGWDDQRQHQAGLRQHHATRALIRGLAGIGFFVAALGVVGPAIDASADTQAHRAPSVTRTVQRDAVAWTDRAGHLQQRTVITVLHRSAP